MLPPASSPTRSSSAANRSFLSSAELRAVEDCAVVLERPDTTAVVGGGKRMAVAVFEVPDSRKADVREKNALFDWLGKALFEVFALRRLDSLLLDVRGSGVVECREAPSVRMAFGMRVEFAENVVCPDSPLRGYSKHLTHDTPPSTHSAFQDGTPSPPRMRESHAPPGTQRRTPPSSRRARLPASSRSRAAPPP